MTRPWLIPFLLAGTVAARGQTAPGPVITLDPLTVTSQHRDQAATEVPISLTAWSGSFLETHGVTRYEDLAPLVPGFVASVQSPNSPGLNLRGISTDTLDPRASMRVSVFQDGVSISRATGSITELFDLERVEVLKGPQGTLFGRSAETGAISLITRKPTPGYSGRLTVGAGNLGHRSVSGFLNAPIADDHLLGRVAFTAVRRDGTVANLADNSTLSGRETVAVRPSLRWLAPGGDTTLDLVFTYQHDTPPGTAFKSGIIPPVGGDTDPYTPADLNRGAILGTDRTVWGASLNLTHRLSPAWTLHTITGWRAFDSQEEFDGDGSRLALLDSTDKSTSRSWSQEVRVNYEAGGRFAGFGGLTWSRERADQAVSVMIDERQLWPFFSGNFRDGLIASGVPAALAGFAVPTMNPFVPQATLPAGFAAFAAVPPLAGLASLAGAPLKSFHREVYTQDAAFDAVDVFLDGTWRATKKLELTAGYRLSLEDQTTGYQVDPAAVPSTLGFIFGATPNFATAPTAGRLTDHARENGWSGRLVARYAFNPDLSAYASHSRGRRPQALVITSIDRYRIGEESVVNAELGLKGRALGHRLLWSAALFEYRYRHFHTLIQDPASPTRFIAIDAGRATGRGGEFTLQGNLAAGVRVFATYGYTDATFDDTGDNGQPQQYAGSSLRLTSRHTAALGATFAREVAGRGRFEFSPVWQYRSAHYFEDDNTRYGGTLRQPGFARVNLRLAWFSPTRRWEVTAWADNLFDKEFLIDAGNIGADFGLPTFIRGEPRLLGLELSRRF
jgi:iron complex outermembrane receptor protein